MTKHNRDLHRLVNPAKLADDTVFALSTIQRGGKIAPELLKEGVELCDYLISLLEELSATGDEKGQLTFRAVRDDKKALQEREIDIDEVRKVRTWINELINDPSSHTFEEIQRMQEFLMITTMPMWQKRALEFRERKLKRGLIIRD